MPITDKASHLLRQKEGFWYYICGPMFASKTERWFVILNMVRYSVMGYDNGEEIFREYFIYTHEKNTRDNNGVIESRFMGGMSVKIDGILSDEDIINLRYRDFKPFTVLFFEELQFVCSENVDAVLETFEILRGQNCLIVASFLDLDFSREPFPIVGPFLARANDGEKCVANCFYPGCENVAHYSQRFLLRGEDPDNVSNVDPGNGEKYAARCLKHHSKEPEVLLI